MEFNLSAFCCKKYLTAECAKFYAKLRKEIFEYSDLRLKNFAPFAVKIFAPFAVNKFRALGGKQQ